MINLVSAIKSNQINFGRSEQARKAPVDAKTENIEKRMNEVFGVTLDEFIKVCDDRKFENTYGMTREEYYDDPDNFASI